MIELSGKTETRSITLESEMWHLIDYWSEFCDLPLERTIAAAMGAYDEVMELGLKEHKEHNVLIADVVSHLRESL